MTSFTNDLLCYSYQLTPDNACIVENDQCETFITLHF